MVDVVVLLDSEVLVMLVVVESQTILLNKGAPRFPRGRNTTRQLPDVVEEAEDEVEVIIQLDWVEKAGTQVALSSQYCSFQFIWILFPA